MCKCCAGLTEFDMFIETCDECCAAMLAGDFDEESHGHALSDEHRRAVAESDGGR